jgi:hypothetical protein
MKEVKLYIAGKVSEDSVFGTRDWRDNFCHQLEEKAGLAIVNLDPTKFADNIDLDQNFAKLVVGRNNHLIKNADAVIVYLSDDISVGGSQEMLIAKYYKRPLIGFAPPGGKFNQSEKEMYGQKIKDYIDPYVRVSCDVVAGTIDELAKHLADLVTNPDGSTKDLTILDEATRYYEDRYRSRDNIGDQ